MIVPFRFPLPPVCLRRNKKGAQVLSGWGCTYLGWELCAGASPPPHEPDTQRGGWEQPAGAVGGEALLCKETESLATVLTSVPG